MAISQCNVTTDVISQLPDKPVTDGGLTSAQFKAKFDQVGLAIKTYINETLIPQITAQFQQKISSSNPVSGSFLTDASVVADKLADLIVTAQKIADSAITAAKLANGSVGTAKIADEAITSAKIASGVVTAAKLGNDITYANVGLAADQVRAIKFGTAVPTTSDISDGEIYIQYTE